MGLIISISWPFIALPAAQANESLPFGETWFAVYKIRATPFS